MPLSDNNDARLKLGDFDRVATELPRNCSVDVYLFWQSDQLHLGTTMFESSSNSLAAVTSLPTPFSAIFGPESTFKIVDGVGLFDDEMHMSGMHGEHGGGKTSSFKRCLFLKEIAA